MNDCHPRSRANYRIVRRMDRTYGVEVTIPGALPTLVTTFAFKDAALGWIEKRQRQVVESPNRHLVSAKPKEKPC
jgi:hypothetical protein